MYIGDIDCQYILNKNHKGTRKSVLMITCQKPERRKILNMQIKMNQHQ